MTASPARLCPHCLGLTKAEVKRLLPVRSGYFCTRCGDQLRDAVCPKRQMLFFRCMEAIGPGAGTNCCACGSDIQEIKGFVLRTYFRPKLVITPVSSRKPFDPIRTIGTTEV